MVEGLPVFFQDQFFLNLMPMGTTYSVPQPGWSPSWTSWPAPASLLAARKFRLIRFRLILAGSRGLLTRPYLTANVQPASVATNCFRPAIPSDDLAATFVSF